jgi:diguanylate cyclase (GGDEF)-like protein
VVRTYDETGERPVPPPVEECLVEGVRAHSSSYLLLRAGSECAIRWSGAPVRDAEGRIDGMVLAFSDITQVLSLSRDMVHLATHDALTGLPNRVLMCDRLELALARARRAGEQVAVLVVDLDGFKRVNDALGHSAGDALLKEVAGRLKASCREEDSVARWGGDEFVVMLEKLHTREAVVRRASYLLESLAKPIVVAEQEVYVTASVGICLAPRDGEDVETLFAHADLAMYRAKDEGRNGFRFYSPRMNGHARENLGMEKALRDALRGEELAMYYQPVIELGSGRLKGVEALIRWPRTTGEVALPKTFLPVVEQSDLVHAIGEWVLRTACTTAARACADGFTDLQVAVNLSPRQLLKSDLYGRIATILEETKAPPNQLVLEIAEDLFLHDSKGVVRNLESLRGLGVHVSIDDFGTGYSSIGYLKYLPIDQIKIDHSFVQDGAANESDATIVRGMVSLARNLQLEIIAEGVETAHQLEFVRSLDVDGVQGFYLAEPMAESALGDFLATRVRPIGQPLHRADGQTRAAMRD